MRVAAEPQQFAQAFNLATQEALAAFARGSLHRKVPGTPRHIEIQIMGDTHAR